MFGKKKKQKPGSVFTMTLHNYHVQVYDNNEKLIHTGIFDGFSAVEAIKSCRKELKEKMLTAKREFCAPIKFYTIIQ